jgi:hypothetical protein
MVAVVAQAVTLPQHQQLAAVVVVQVTIKQAPQVFLDKDFRVVVVGLVVSVVGVAAQAALALWEMLLLVAEMAVQDYHLTLAVKHNIIVAEAEPIQEWITVLDALAV